MGARGEVRNSMKGGAEMTEMRRVTISLPEELDKRLMELKKDDRFVRCSYSELVRQVLDHGFTVFADEKEKGA